MKRSRIFLWSGLVSMLTSSAAWAEDPVVVKKEAGPRKEGVLFARYETIDPAMVREAEALAAASCPDSGLVAFSVSGISHISKGGLVLLSYPTIHTLEGGGWVSGGGTFVAPCAGMYFFNVSFVKDAYYHGATADDVFVHVLKNGVDKGRATSGQGNVDRGTGTYSVTLFLKQGDYVQTFVSGDGDAKRHLLEFNFTGHLVKQLP